MTDKILIVEDDEEFLDSLSELLNTSGYEIEVATSAKEAKQKMDKEVYSLVLSDIQMPGEDGMWLIKNTDIQRTPVVLMTAYATVDRAVEALKLGVKDFLTKPFARKKLIATIEAHSVPVIPDEIIIEDDSSKKIAEELRAVALHDGTPVLLMGESGVGKDVLANLFHTYSNREGKFVSVNCGAIPSNMLESILFGHEKGSFTGANKKHDGKFIQANNGTLFLDEIGEMPLELQVKLLRVLETRTVERVGSSEEVEIDINLVTATNANLEKMIEEGEFRLDLFYRINVIQIEVPPLRERKKDLQKLVNMMISNFSKKYDKKLTISKEALNKVNNYDWPGNIRELSNIINRAVIKSYTQIDESDIILPIKEQEKELSIEQALKQNNGNRKKTAESLGISLRTLQYRIKKLGLKTRD